MKKILNFRYVFFAFVSFLFAILTAKYILKSNIYVMTIVCSIFIAYLVFAIIFNKHIQFILITIMYILGLLTFYFAVENYVDKNILGEKQISARVMTETYCNNSYQLLILDNVKIDGKQINSCIQAKVYSEYINMFLEQGAEIEFEAEILQNNIMELGEIQSYYYKNNIPYYLETNTEEITVVSHKIEFFESIRTDVKELLHKIMSPNNADVAFAVLFGDKSDVDVELKSTYSESGIAHLLAVSGLHISVIVYTLIFILKRMKMKRHTAFWIITTLIIFYCFLCGFSPSVVRASIMSVVILIAKLFYREYDQLNSVGIAGLIILSVRPLYAFDVGFLLSFASVISIFLLSKTFSRWFSNIKIPEYLANLLAISLSASIGTLPLILRYYGTFSLLVVVANIIAVPLFSAGFTILIIGLPLVIASNFFLPMLHLTDYIFALTNKIAETFANISGAIINLSITLTALIFAYYISLFLISRFIRLKFKTKMLCVLPVIIISLLISFFGHLPANFTSDTYSNIKNSSAVVLTTSENNVLLIEKDKLDIQTVQNYLDYRNIKKVDYLILIKKQNNVSDVKNFIDKYKVEKIYCNDNNYENIKAINEEIVEKVESEINITNNIKLEFFKPIDKAKSLFLKVSNTNILFTEKLTELEEENLAILLYQKDFNIDILDGVINIETPFINNKTTLINGSKSKIVDNINLQDYGNFTFEFKNDNITKLRTID